MFRNMPIVSIDLAFPEHGSSSTSEDVYIRMPLDAAGLDQEVPVMVLLQSRPSLTLE